MNYAHNNLRLKKLQFQIEKFFNFVNKVRNFIKPQKQEVELVDVSLPQLPNKKR